MENENQKPLTLEQLANYNREVLLPAIDSKINNLSTRDEFFRLEKKVDSLENGFKEFKNESLTNQDKMLKKLDTLIQENEVRNYQEKKQKEFFAIMINAMKNHNILSQEEIQKISQLNIF